MVSQQPPWRCNRHRKVLERSGACRTWRHQRKQPGSIVLNVLFDRASRGAARSGCSSTPEMSKTLLPSKFRVDEPSLAGVLTVVDAALRHATSRCGCRGGGVRDLDHHSGSGDGLATAPRVVAEHVMPAVVAFMNDRDEEEQEERTVLARAASPVRRPPLSKQGRAQQCRAELEGDLVSTSSDATTMCGGTALYVYGC
jgi:hypothetical protein